MWITISNNKKLKTSNKICKLTNKRDNKIKDYLHKSSKYVIDLCIKENIGNIIIGKNLDWKDSINIGVVNNQNFVCVPFNSLVDMIIYNGKLCGIVVEIIDESYTSKASFLDRDEIPTYNKDEMVKHVFSGKRIERGMYRSKECKLIHADVNGSYNIIVKGVFNAFAERIEGVAVHPAIVSMRR